jgi:putative ABC transport system permease protein
MKCNGSIRRCHFFEVKTLREHMGIPLFPARVAPGALGSFGILALVLGAVGIYGVMSNVVAGRVREIGLRMALGAQSRDVRRLILRQGMWLALIGSVIGVAAALGVTRMLTSLLYGVSAHDLSTFVFVTLLLAAVAALACLLPANRATRVNPMQALRAE